MKFKLTCSRFAYYGGTHTLLEKLGFAFIQHPTREDVMVHALEQDDPSIDINSLEELMAFIKEHGEIIMDGRRIEIYNDYRE